MRISITEVLKIYKSLSISILTFVKLFDKIMMNKAKIKIRYES